MQCFVRVASHVVQRFSFEPKIGDNHPSYNPELVVFILSLFGEVGRNFNRGISGREDVLAAKAIELRQCR